MSEGKRKKIESSLGQLLYKIAVMTVTISIGLWCGWIDSYGAFYIAVLLQAINNVYDASNYFTGYTKFVTIFQVVSFLGGLCSFVIAIIHFTLKGSIVDKHQIVVLVTILLSIPILHFGIEVYNMIRQDRY